MKLKNKQTQPAKDKTQLNNKQAKTKQPAAQTKAKQQLNSKPAKAKAQSKAKQQLNNKQAKTKQPAVQTKAKQQLNNKQAKTKAQSKAKTQPAKDKTQLNNKQAKTKQPAVQAKAKQQSKTKTQPAKAPIKKPAPMNKKRPKLKQTIRFKMLPSYPLTKAQRQKLIEEYTPLIRFIAKKISVRLPANIDVEDLVSNGVIGLMDAIDKYDSTRDNKFKTYAEFRIRGAILDGLRAQDWVPRSVRDKAKMLERSHAHLESELGRPPTDEETAEHLGLTTKEFYNLLNQVQPVNVLSIDSASSFNNMDRKSFFHLLQAESDPFSHLNVKFVKTEIKKMIAELPERQRIVLSLYYYEGFNLRKIGTILGVTESRVSQLHAQAIQRLKVKLEQAFKEHELKKVA